MSIAEMKLQAIRKIICVNDETILLQLLTLLNGSADSNVLSYRLNGTYDEVKDRYGEVLKKLAE